MIDIVHHVTVPTRIPSVDLSLKMPGEISRMKTATESFEKHWLANHRILET